MGDEHEDDGKGVGPCRRTTVTFDPTGKCRASRAITPGEAIEWIDDGVAAPPKRR